MRILDLYTEKSPVISMEFFPYRDEKTETSFNKVADDLLNVNPDYLTVTFGAGGSTRDGSYQTVKTILEKKNKPCVAYIAGYGLGPDEITEVLDRFKSLGVQTVFVIRGDKPRQDDFTPHPDSFSYASELIRFIKERYDFTLGCAGYPEGHVDAPDFKTDLGHTRTKVENGADYIVAQYFYDNDYFFNYVSACRDAGIDVPIIPGIMPVYTVKMTHALARICGATLTPALVQKLDAVDPEDKEAVLNLGIDFAVEQCKDLLSRGVPGLHFYTMNRSRSIKEIISRLEW
ncbi:MAG: 5,10-methylenetetrahydrofolate reductase [Desulfobacteraceae bacterium]|nr:MAG: 5,10-methylenetetrahydrofolate reductase [Desulfobacteraceae bacterium]